jgi:acetyltransferase
MTRSPFDYFFSPRAVALVGASEKPNTLGNAVIQNMLDAGYKGDLYPVNPKYRKIHGLKCYRSVSDIEAEVDFVVIFTPARTVTDIVKACGKKGVPALLILSAGFKEAGDKGQAALDQILQYGRKYHMRIIGPNCLGIMNPAVGLNATFAARGARPGKIAFISQSGAVCASILDWAAENQIGFSYLVSIGSMADVGFHDLIEYMSADPNTSSILIYMETLSEARKFMSAARAYARLKPIIVLKAGSSEQGAQAAMSHTGSLAGNDKVFDAAFRRAGVLRVSRIADLFNCAQALAMQPRPKGNRLAIVTNAGGPAVLATDHLENHGGHLASLSETTMDMLNQHLSDFWSHGNPVDILGDGSAEHFALALKACAADPGVDAVLVMFVPQAITPAEEVARVIVETGKNIQKPIYASWMGEVDVAAAREVFELGGIPNYTYPESAVDVFLFMNQYRHNLRLLYETPDEVPGNFVPDRDKVRKIIYQALDAGRRQLDRAEIVHILEAYDIPVTPVYPAADADAAVDAATKIGYPVALKIASPDISHKTDVGGVILDLRNDAEVRQQFEAVTQRAREQRPGADIQGVTIEAMVHKRHELIIGSKLDPVFGPVIVFGMGGIAVEVFKDTRMGLPPLNMALARHLVQGTRIFTLLQGYRKMPPVDLDAIYFLLIRYAYLMMDFPEISESDLNPYSVDEHGGLVLDARMGIAPPQPQWQRPFDHLVISPYPSQYVRRLEWREGLSLTLRPIRPEDEPLERDLLQRLSKESIYYRFFGYLPRIDQEFFNRFTHIDYDREMAIVAEANLDGKPSLLGVVRIVGDHTAENAEYAIVIADDWQRQGLGSLLTDYILNIARDLRFKTISASYMATNIGMDHLFRQKGFSISYEDGRSYRAVLTLT